MRIVVIGSIALDDVTTQHGVVTDAPGGSALYFTASASLFAPVSLIGVVGEDFPAEEIEFLRKRDVDLSRLEVIEGGKTFRWAGTYATDMNIRQTTNLELNVFETFNPVLDDVHRNPDLLFLGNIDPDIQLRLLDAAGTAKFTGMDTIECYIKDKPDTLKQVLRRVDMVLINDEEARLITGESNIITAARALLDLGPRYAVVKKGEHGSILSSREGLFIVPAYPIHDVIDPTGAGDSYAGGMFGYLASQGKLDDATVRRAVVHGGIAASFTVEDFSTRRLKSLTPHDIEERLTLFRSITLF